MSRAQAGSLWSEARRGGGANIAPDNHRTAFEKDYDRLLFSSAVRRMADKTQVFPLEKHASVRNRLTHSHEVSNLARSIGNRLVRRNSSLFNSEEIRNAVPVILAATGLSHDLGNPPFGHRGEDAIRAWFKSKGEDIFVPKGADDVPKDLRGDFLQFEGNAQTLRLVGCLQVSSGGLGLDLTAATLAALMKYTVPAAKVDRASGNAAQKKPGFAASESELVEWIRVETGLKEGQRHPLTWIMEACDDIAYSVLDVEDAIKKSIISPEDTLHYLEKSCPQSDDLCSDLRNDFQKTDAGISPERAREIKASYLRTRLIEKFVTGVSDTFDRDFSKIAAFEQKISLIESDQGANELYDHLKKFARRYAYNHPNVLRKELEGALALSKLMDWIWLSIISREDSKDLASKRVGAFPIYVYSLISDNYKWEMESGNSSKRLPLRYKELRLLVDMVSGMTDKYVMELYDSLEPLSRG